MNQSIRHGQICVSPLALIWVCEEQEYWLGISSNIWSSYWFAHTKHVHFHYYFSYSKFLPLTVKYMQSLKSAQWLPVHNLQISKTQKWMHLVLLHWRSLCSVITKYQALNIIILKSELHPTCVDPSELLMLKNFCSWGSCKVTWGMI